MKYIYKKPLLQWPWLLMLSLVFFSSIALAQEKEPGVVNDAIRIKVTEQAAQHLEMSKKSMSRDGYVLTGLSSLDQLSSEHKVTSIKRVFRHGGKYEAKHRKHGLHLWYEVAVRSDKSMSSVTSAYEQLADVQLAENIYEKTRGYDPSSVEAYKRVPLTDPADDPRLNNQWHYNNTGQSGGMDGADISLFQAWGLETGTSDVIVAVTDGGIDVDHADLQANMWVNEGEIPGNGIDDDGNGYIDDVNGYGFGDNSGTIPADSHGTHVGGTVAASTNNGVGVAGVAGGSGAGDGVRLMSCAAFGATGTGGFADTYIYAADNGAVISQNSWGYTNPGVFEQAVLDAIDYFIAEAGYDELGNPIGPMQGGIVIFAAGNSGTDAEWWPGIYEPVMAVAGTDHNDNQYTSSNRGGWVEVAAPAVNVYSTFPNNTYGAISGTSMACPHVSGVAALIVSKFAGNITPVQVKDRLVQTADFVDALPFGFGSGRLNAFNALQDNDGAPPEAITDLAVEDTFQNSVELTWTAPSDPGNGSASIYDLRYSTSPITEANFDSATVVEDVPLPATAGTVESVVVDGLLPSTTYYFAIKSIDFFGNRSDLSNVVSSTTENAPVISVSPDSISASIDVTVDPVETATLTIENLGDGADLNFDMSTVLVSQSQSFTNQLYPGDGLSKINMAQYGAGNPAEAKEAATRGKVRKSSIRQTANGIDVVDSIAYDAADNIAEDFAGLTSGAAYSTAVRFEVENNFQLTHIRNFFRTETMTDPTTILEIYKGATFPSAELLLSQEVTLSSQEGEFFVTPLEVPQAFADGDVFWVVHKYPNGVEFPQGVDEGISQRPNTFFFSGDGGSTFSPSGFIFKVRALSASGMGIDWISYDPVSGTIAPGGSEEVEVTFDASNVANGIYNLHLVVSNNDPNNAKVNVPATIEVSGQQPNILIPATLLEFGSVFIGANKELPLTIKNSGMGDLEISSISSSSFAFTTDVSNLTLSPDEEAIVNVTFAPTFAGNINGTLTINSNDPDESALEIIMVGVGTSPPVIDVTPEQVSATLDAGETGTEQITITNQGNYPLTFSFPDLAIDQLLSNPEVKRNNTEPIQFAAIESKEQLDSRVGHPVLLGAGTDLDFGYKWIDSNEAGGPVFSWDDISESGTEVNAGSDDGFTEIELPFTFNFYGEDKDAVKIGSNGYLTFGVDGTDFTNDQIPDAQDPNDYIAPFWDDLRPSSERGNIYYELRPGKLIVQYHEVGNYAGSGNATFQVVISSSGDIQFYYLSMSTLSNSQSATVGIENADATDGAQIVFNNAYVADSMAVMIIPPQPEFITDASPLTGVVPVNQQVEVDITLDATELYDGTYMNDLIISSNDPANPTMAIPFELTVIGYPVIDVEPDTLTFDSLFVGLTREMELSVLNTGTKTLEVSSITNSNSEFQIDFSGPVSVSPGSGINVPVTFEPTTIGLVTDEIVINSNDSEGNETLTVPVSGVGVDPPVIQVSPDSIIATVDAGDVAYDTLTIENTGGYELRYSLAGTYWFDMDVVQQSNAPILEFEEITSKDAADKRKGYPALSGGGVDNSFGYAWEDNKDGAGPEFDWNNISGSGTDITADLVSGSFADGAKEVAIGFDFNFYGVTYESLWISANGFVSFTEPGSSFTNRQIPVDDAVNNVIAGFWDDLEPGAIQGTVAYLAEADKFVVQYTDVAAFGSSSEGSVTFQIIIYADGNIKLQYEDVEAANFSNSGTVGIENETGTDGVQVVFNSSYINNGLAVMFEPPLTGTVAPGEVETVAVTFDASGLNHGVYEENIRISSNDPVTPEVIVPVTLTVIGTPDIEVTPDSLEFGQVYVHPDSTFSKTLDLTVKNSGSRELTVDNLYTMDRQFVLSDTSGFTLAPKAERSVSVTFTPDSVRTFDSSLIIVSNDEVDNVLTVGLRGEGIAPPAFTATTPGDTIYAKVKSTGTASDVINIGNVEGGSTLEFSASVQYMPQGFDQESTVLQKDYPRANVTPPANGFIAKAGVEVVSVTKMADEPDFADSLYYETSNVADDFVGIPDAATPFSAATKFTAPSGGFVLTHVRNFYRTEGSTDPVTLEVYRGGSDPSLGDLIATQSVHGGSDEGSFDVISLEDAQAFNAGEVFWVVFHYPVSMIFTQGMNSDITGVEGIFHYSNNDGFTWVPAENDLPGVAFKVRALQSLAEWITLDPTSGEVAAGGTASIDVMLDGSATDGGQYYAKVKVESNDPFNPSEEIPVIFEVNRLPEFIQGPADTLSVNENGELHAVFKAVDHDGEVLLYTLNEMYDNVTFSATADSAVVSFEPDFSQSGYYTFTVEALDDMLEVTSRSFVVEVNDVNRPPVIEEQIPRHKYRVGDGTDAIDLSAYIKDPDFDVLSFTASASNPEFVDVSVSGKILLLTPLAKGNTYVSVIAEDGRGGQIGTSFEVRVRKANNAPVVRQEMSDQKVVLDDESLIINLSDMFEDPDNDILSYEAESSDEAIVTTHIAENLLVLIKHAVGDVNITISALDDKGGKVSTVFNTKVGRVLGTDEEVSVDGLGLTNYPNPMETHTTFRYMLEKKQQVKLEILAYNGQSVSVLVDEEQNAGEHKVEYNGHQLNPGIYLYRIQVGDKIYHKRLAVK